MSTVPVRKASAGSDSWGHVWPKDGAVVDVDYEQALTLVGIPDGGFSIAEDKRQPDVTEPAPAQEELSEVDPTSQDATDSAPAKKTAARRRTQS